MREMDIDLEVSELTEGVEYMAEWDALASFSSFSSASCPVNSASTASSLGQSKSTDVRRISNGY